MKVTVLNKCSLIFCYVLLVLRNASVAAVNCGTEFSTVNGTGGVTSQTSFDSVVPIIIVVPESAALGSTLYTVQWTSNASQTSTDAVDTGDDGWSYMEYDEDLALNAIYVKPNASMIGLVDYIYTSASERQESLTISIFVHFDDATICQLLLTHNLLDDNTQDPHFEMSSYKVEIREDYLVFYPIAVLQPNAFDLDASSPNNVFSVTLDSDCPMAAIEDSFTCTAGAAVVVQFELVSSLDYDTMVSPYEYLCTATLKDSGDPSRTSTSDITIVVANFPDEEPIFSVNTYNGVVESVTVGSVASTDPTIIATDPDVPPTNVSYSMEDSIDTTHGLDYFKIDAFSAEITVIKYLDASFLALRQVVFILSATDENEQVGHAVLTISLPPESALTTAEPTTCPACPSCPSWNTGLTDPMTSEVTCPALTCDPCGTTCLPCDCPTTSGLLTTDLLAFTNSTMVTTESTQSSTESTPPSTESTPSSTESTPPSAESTITSSLTTCPSPSVNDIEFLVNVYTFQCLTTSVLVGKVTAVAKDGSTVVYFWSEGSLPGANYFNIDGSTGEITAIAADNTPAGQYELTALASATGLQSAEATVNIEVYVPWDSSDVIMLTSLVNVEVFENSKDDNLVTLQVTATNSSEVVYCIMDITPAGFNGFFALDKSTGTLSVIKELDADDPLLGNQAAIKVGAYSDQSIVCATGMKAVPDETLLKNEALINVMILDENDNAPIFETDINTKSGSRIFAYPRETNLQRAIGPVGTVLAVDADVTGVITYSMATTTNFVVDQQTGDIYLYSTFECFQISCEFNVTASDTSNTAWQTISILGLEVANIHTLMLGFIDVTDVDTILANMSSQTGVNIHELYTTLVAPTSKATEVWEAQVQVYAESEGKLLNLADFNSKLEASQLTTATTFSDAEAFSSTTTDNTGYKVAVGILAAVLGIIIIAGIVYLVIRHKRKKKLSHFPPKQISTLGKSYADYITHPEDKMKNPREESFFTIFGSESVDNKSTTSLTSSSTVSSKGHRRNDTKTTTITTAEAYNNFALEGDPPTYLDAPNKAEANVQRGGSSGDLESSHHLRQWETLEESHRKDSRALYPSLGVDNQRRDSLGLYPSMTDENDEGNRSYLPKVQVRHDLPRSASLSDDSSLRSQGSSKGALDDSEKKSVAFKVLTETKEYEKDAPDDEDLEKSVAFKVLVETRTIEREKPDTGPEIAIL